MSELLPILIGSTGLSEFDIRLILSNAPSRYKHFKIKKRNGEDRRISQPARELKALQRSLISALLTRLPVHEAAMAYRSGVSIADNAKAHVHNGPILKYDFSDFFPSIRSRDWEKFCRAHSVLRTEEDIWISERILFQRDKGSRVLKLSIGAPSSPILSNILMYEFDAAISNAVARDKVTYTRYADDLTFSAPRTGFLTNVDDLLRKTLREVPWPKLVVNEKKTVLATTKYRREVTGLVLSNAGAVSLGRDKKRAIRAAVHHAKCDKLTEKQLSHLCGMLAFVHSVEPEFLIRLKEHYGEAVFAYLKRYASVSRRIDVPAAANGESGMAPSWLASFSNLRTVVDHGRAGDRRGTLARIGEALLAAQVVENTLRFALTFVLQKKGELTLERLEAQTEAERTKTVGYFLDQMHRRADIHPAVATRLSAFLEMRNQLVHRVDTVPGWSLDNDSGLRAANDFLTDLLATGHWVHFWLAGLIRSWQDQTDMATAFDHDPTVAMVDEVFRNLAEATIQPLTRPKTDR